MTIRDLPPLVREDLGDGLILRAATSADAEQLAAFNEAVHLGGTGQGDLVAGAWTRDLLRGDHPTSPVGDFSLVEDTKTGRIASSCLLLSQEWRYGGIAMPIGRPELVGTDPDYRGRGLIERQFAAIHRRSDERGHLFQAITGIPYYYARVGYQPTLVHPPQGFGTIEELRAAFPVSSNLRTRSAGPDDLEFVTAAMERADRRGLLSCHRDRELWRYEYFGRSRNSDFVSEMRILETDGGRRVGLIAYLVELIFGRLMILALEAADDAWWPDVVPAALADAASAYERMEGSQNGKREIAVSLVPGHPLFARAPGFRPQRGNPFAWEVRIPDRVRFVRTIAPILEDRLVASPFAGLTRDLEMTFFESGLKMSFIEGRLDKVEAWRPPIVWLADLRILPRAFDTLLMGSRSIDQLVEAFPEIRIRPEDDRDLLATLFPAIPSAIWPVA
jgi:hypothetical protein